MEARIPEVDWRERNRDPINQRNRAKIGPYPKSRLESSSLRKKDPGNGGQALLRPGKQGKGVIAKSDGATEQPALSKL